jgi:hypothetical protein
MIFMDTKDEIINVFSKLKQRIGNQEIKYVDEESIKLECLERIFANASKKPLTNIIDPNKVMRIEIEYNLVPSTNFKTECWADVQGILASTNFRFVQQLFPEEIFLANEQEKQFCLKTKCYVPTSKIETAGFDILDIINKINSSELKVESKVSCEGIEVIAHAKATNAIGDNFRIITKNIK